jgi:hypothetical protein
MAKSPLGCIPTSGGGTVPLAWDHGNGSEAAGKVCQRSVTVLHNFCLAPGYQNHPNGRLEQGLRLPLDTDFCCGLLPSWQLKRIPVKISCCGSLRWSWWRWRFSGTNAKRLPKTAAGRHRSILLATNNVLITLLAARGAFGGNCVFPSVPSIREFAWRLSKLVPRVTPF